MESRQSGMRYAVYVNWTRRRACWHREGCGYIKMHGGTADGANQEWIWCDSVPEVHRILRSKAHGFPPSEVAPCGSCRPDTGE